MDSHNTEQHADDEALMFVEEPILLDDDVRTYPEFVENQGTIGTDENDIVVQFEGTDDEERQENTEMGVHEHENLDRPVIEYDMENPSLAEGSIFPSMVDCRNALATFCIKGEYDFLIDNSEPTRYTVHCAFLRCKWRLHASRMRNSSYIQVKVNPFPHSCPSAGRKHTQKAAKSRWCADKMLKWVRDNPSIGPTQLIKNLYEEYNVIVPYMRVYYGKEMAFDEIYGPWKESFQLLYTFKSEVEKACLGSVVEIDKHKVEYKVRGMIREKECFRRVFVSFKACWNGFLVGCRPYLAVDATALTGRFRKQLVTACAIDARGLSLEVPQADSHATLELPEPVGDLHATLLLPEPVGDVHATLLLPEPVGDVHASLELPELVGDVHASLELPKLVGDVHASLELPKLVGDVHASLELPQPVELPQPDLQAGPSRKKSPPKEKKTRKRRKPVAPTRNKRVPKPRLMMNL